MIWSSLHGWAQSKRMSDNFQAKSKKGNKHEGVTMTLLLNHWCMVRTMWDPELNFVGLPVGKEVPTLMIQDAFYSITHLAQQQYYVSCQSSVHTDINSGFVSLGRKIWRWTNKVLFLSYSYKHWSAGAVYTVGASSALLRQNQSPQTAAYIPAPPLCMEMGGRDKGPMQHSAQGPITAQVIKWIKWDWKE